MKQNNWEVNRTSDLREWWLEQAEAEIDGMLRKTAEYGGRGRAWDLIAIGRDLAQAMGWTEITDAEATELGVAFYIRGKLGRAMAAYADHRLPSDDTWHDVSVYTRMLQRARAEGGWPR